MNPRLLGRRRQGEVKTGEEFCKQENVIGGQCARSGKLIKCLVRRKAGHHHRVFHCIAVAVDSGEGRSAAYRRDADVKIRTVAFVDA